MDPSLEGQGARSEQNKSSDMNQSMTSGVSMDLECPAWDLSTEYESVESEKFQGDLKVLEVLLDKIRSHGEKLETCLGSVEIDDLAFKALCPVAQETRKLVNEAFMVSWDMAAFVECFLSVESSNEPATKMKAKLDEIAADFAAYAVPLDGFEVRLSDNQFEQYLANSTVKEAEFYLSRRRAFMKDFILPPEQEKILAALAPSGFDAWWNLYREISKRITVEVKLGGELKNLGLAETDELLADPDRDVRQRVWEATNEAWKVYELTAGQGLNSIVGLRLKEDELRSGKRTRHYLDSALHHGAVQKETIEAMMSVAKKNLPTAHKAMALIAEGIGGSHYEPWDKFAPLPDSLKKDAAETTKIRFPEAVESVRAAFASFHPEMGEFVDFCVRSRVIEARNLPGKAPGAFSHLFVRSGMAPVYMSFSGSLDQVFTLAHELGHSLHSHSMNDLPFAQREYPMTVAETASNVGEMLLSGYRFNDANPYEVLSTNWNDIQAGIAYLVNIPVRYEFEKAFYERRKDEFLTPKDLSEMMLKAHEDWYGDGMQTKDPMFWASKQHFHFSDISFYNFPYTFGYMFAAGIYVRIQSEGSDFYPAYINLLRDTGRMTAEDLAMKHLGVDLTKEEFWQTSYNAFEAKVRSFETALRQIL